MDSCGLWSPLSEGLNAAAAFGTAFPAVVALDGLSLVLAGSPLQVEKSSIVLAVANVFAPRLRMADGDRWRIVCPASIKSRRVFVSSDVAPLRC
jgi:hypothetical protein